MYFHVPGPGVALAQQLTMNLLSLSLHLNSLPDTRMVAACCGITLSAGCGCLDMAAGSAAVVEAVPAFDGH